MKFFLWIVKVREFIDLIPLVDIVEFMLVRRTSC